MIARYQEVFGTAENVRVFRAPGRANLIGEHTDYNDGFVLPTALELATWIARGPRQDGKLCVHSLDRHESREFDVARLADLKPTKHWTDYVIGVGQLLLKQGYSIDPANFLIGSTVPDGSGLSSSAALEVSSGLAFLKGRKIDGITLAKLCQRAEIDFVGMPCGIMDQYISVFGQAHRAIRIDCRTLEGRPVALPSGIAILVVNSLVKHELASSAYRERVAQCAAAVEAIQKVDPHVLKLRDATLGLLTRSEMDPVVRRRAHHIITEDLRVDEFIALAERADFRGMGQLWTTAHRSLQHDFEISCEELDFLVETAIQIPGAWGARMTGGGFGGCTINLVAEDAVEPFTKAIVDAYAARYHKQAPVFRCVPSSGAGEVTGSADIPVFHPSA
jgi:galactokinase